MGFGVIDARVKVHVLASADHEEPIQRAGRAFGIKHHVDVVSCQLAAERDGVRGETAVAILTNL